MVNLLPRIIIVSQFGMRTLSYINDGKPHLHKGIDIRAPFGTEIAAPCDVTIDRHGVGQYGEGFIVATFAYDLSFKFIHCKAPEGIKDGARIAAGEIVAISDGSGTTDGKGGKAPHLHFETWRDRDGRTPGAAFNPETFMTMNVIPFEYSEELKKRLGLA